MRRVNKNERPRTETPNRLFDEAMRPTGRDIVFLDVETPNSQNDSICSIGVIRTTAGGDILAREYFLVDPQAHFSQFNTDIHGLTAADVRGEMNFAQLWDASLSRLLSNADLVAHNATFDLGVLRKCLERYGRYAEPCRYACTMKLSRSLMPALPNHKLDTVAEFVGVPLEHHHAMSDAEACMAVFWYLRNKRGLLRAQGWEPYEFSFRGDVRSALSERALLEQRAKHFLDALPEAVERNAGGIDMNGAVFCLTGDFLCSPTDKDAVVAYLVGLGGIQAKSVTLKCDYLIVGSLGSDRWKNGNYGNKIAKAIDYRRTKKTNVRIVDEASVIGDDFHA